MKRALCSGALLIQVLWICAPTVSAQGIQEGFDKLRRSTSGKSMLRCPFADKGCPWHYMASKSEQHALREHMAVCSYRKASFSGGAGATELEQYAARAFLAGRPKEGVMALGASVGSRLIAGLFSGSSSSRNRRWQEEERRRLEAEWTAELVRMAEEDARRRDADAVEARVSWDRRDKERERGLEGVFDVAESIGTRRRSGIFGVEEETSLAEDTGDEEETPFQEEAEDFESFPVPLQNVEAVMRSSLPHVLADPPPTEPERPDTWEAMASATEREGGENTILCSVNGAGKKAANAGKPWWKSLNRELAIRYTSYSEEDLALLGLSRRPYVIPSLDSSRADSVSVFHWTMPIASKNADPFYAGASDGKCLCARAGVADCRCWNPSLCRGWRICERGLTDPDCAGCPPKCNFAGSFACCVTSHSEPPMGTTRCDRHCRCRHVKGGPESCGSSCMNCPALR